LNVEVAEDLVFEHAKIEEGGGYFRRFELVEMKLATRLHPGSYRTDL